MTIDLHLSRLDSLLQLERSHLLSLVPAQPCWLEVIRGSVWLTQGADDVIVEAGGVHLLLPGARVVVEALVADTSLCLQAFAAAAVASKTMTGSRTPPAVQCTPCWCPA